MIFRLTQELASKIKVQLSETLPLSHSPFIDWSAKLFRSGRLQYILLTNTKSLYSVVLKSACITDRHKFMDCAIDAIKKAMADDGLPYFQEHIEPYTIRAALSKPINRSVAASINSVAHRAKRLLGEAKQSARETTRNLNRTPIKSLGALYPVEAIQQMDQLPDIHIAAPSPKRALDKDKPRCGLCGKTTKLTKTECCGNWICDDLDDYELFSFQRNSCYRNHLRFTLCGYHYNEGHEGAWNTCEKCRSDFEAEIAAWYGTNDYNFEKMSNPPKYKPKHCAACGVALSLGDGGYSMSGDKYWCERCSIEKMRKYGIKF